MTRQTPLARRIEAAIEASGLKHMDVAVAVGVSRPIITQWCQGIRAPRRENLLALAQVLGTSVAWLQEGVHVIRVEDRRLAELMMRLQEAPEPIREAVSTLLPPSPKAA
jgi:transcriptional regulator with XRE-family HTH domain